MELTVGEGEDSNIIPPDPSLQTLAPSLSTSPPALALGLGLGFLLFVRAGSLEPLSAAVKLAGGAVKGAVALRCLRSPPSPSPHRALLLASKALVKGYKASKRLNPTPRSPSTAASRRLKGCLGAVNLVRYAGYPLLADGFLGLGFLTGGYKLSKNFVKVLEGFVGLQLDSVLRRRIDSLGLLVKAAIIVRELEWRFAAGGLGRTRYGFALVSPVDRRYRVHLHYKRIVLVDTLADVRDSNMEGFACCEGGGLFGGISLEVCLSELLSLSIPINEVIPLNLL